MSGESIQSNGDSVRLSRETNGYVTNSEREHRPAIEVTPKATSRPIREEGKGSIKLQQTLEPANAYVWDPIDELRAVAIMKEANADKQSMEKSTAIKNQRALMKLFDSDNDGNEDI